MGSNNRHESWPEAIQRRQAPGHPCSAKGCFQIRQTISGYCRHHAQQISMFGHPTEAGKPPRGTYRRKMIRAVHAALLDLDLPKEIIAFTATLSRRLADWSEKLKKPWAQQAAGRMANVDGLLLLAAVTAWHLYESEYRDIRALRSERPGWLAGKRLRRFEARQLTLWLRHVTNVRGFRNQSHPMRGWSVVSDLMLQFRFPTKLNSVAAGLARVVGPTVREEMVAARREVQAKQTAAAEKAIKEMSPFGQNADGSFDIMRSDHYIKTKENAEQ